MYAATQIIRFGLCVLTEELVNANITVVMGKENVENSRNNIIEAAKTEFLKNGYKGAGLRTICKNAGVTTGAFYFQFENKEKVLDEILQPVLVLFNSVMAQIFKGEYEEEGSSADGDERMLEMIWTYKTEFQILAAGVEGTKYEPVFRQFQEGLKNGFRIFFEKCGVSEIDPELLDVLVRMRMESYLAIINKDYSLEETKRLARLIGEYCDAGFEALTEKLKQNKVGK